MSLYLKEAYFNSKIHKIKGNNIGMNGTWITGIERIFID